MLKPCEERFHELDHDVAAGEAPTGASAGTLLRMDLTEGNS